MIFQSNRDILYLYYCIQRQIAHKGDSKWLLVIRNYGTSLLTENMKKKDLEEAAGITHYQMYKLANDKDITTDVIGAICAALEVEPNDIMDFVPDSK